MESGAAVVGVGQTDYTTRRRDLNYQELVREAALKVLDDAGLSVKDIDAFIFGGGPEAMIGVDAPEKWIAEAMGAWNKPFLRINTGGSTGSSAAAAGFYHVMSGMFDTVMVLAAEKMGDSPDAQTILNKIWDPIYEGDAALNIIVLSAFATVRYMKNWGMTEEDMALVSVKNHLNAFNNPHAHLKIKITVDDVLNSRVICWPIKLLDACPRSTGACAVIITTREKARKVTDTPAYIKGFTHISETYYTGDRLGTHGFFDIGRVDAGLVAAKRAYMMAGIRRPEKEIQVAEPYVPFSSFEIMTYEGLGFCKEGEGAKLLREGVFDMGGDIPVSPSGGVMSSNPISATALVRVAEAALQVMGKGGKRQVPNVENAIATGAGGAAQFFDIIILGREP
ncbi:MAG: thiolase family protein [Candidatus Lokiarchaeia archaeon]